MSNSNLTRYFADVNNTDGYAHKIVNFASTDDEWVSHRATNNERVFKTLAGLNRSLDAYWTDGSEYAVVIWETTGHGFEADVCQL